MYRRRGTAGFLAEQEVVPIRRLMIVKACRGSCGQQVKLSSRGACGVQIGVEGWETSDLDLTAIIQGGLANGLGREGKADGVDDDHGKVETGPDPHHRTHVIRIVRLKKAQAHSKPAFTVNYLAMIAALRRIRVQGFTHIYEAIKPNP